MASRPGSRRLKLTRFLRLTSPYNLSSSNSLARGAGQGSQAHLRSTFKPLPEAAQATYNGKPVWRDSIAPRGIFEISWLMTRDKLTWTVTSRDPHSGEASIWYA